jgi:hypothetical protein
VKRAGCAHIYIGIFAAENLFPGSLQRGVYQTLKGRR